jgi:diguanylate cyclase (GGDEF)-like protein
MGSDDTRSIERALDDSRRRGIARLLQRPFKSLPARIITSVFAAALVTSLCVTWISSRSIESFLRAKIDQKFPSILWGAGERLDLWYAQREIDVATFARSHTMVDSLRAKGVSDSVSRKELSNYLTYVLGLFPQYETLFVLDPSGRRVIAVGELLVLPDARREQISRIRAPQVGGLEQLGERQVQIASAPVKDNMGRRLATLHAVLRSETVADTLRNDEAGAVDLVYVVGPDGRVLLQPPGATPHKRYEHALPEEHGAPHVEEYVLSDGTTVVGSAVAFSRFGWTLVVEEPYEAAFAPVVLLIREIFGINLGVVLVFGVISLQIARSIVRPIRELSNAALRIATGETDVTIQEAASDDDIGILNRAFNKMSLQLQANRRELEDNRREIEDANVRLVSQNEELQRVNEVFQQLSITDELTRLHNHRYFQEHLPRETKRAQRTGEALSLILIDLDDFKQLNDTHGHAVGDAVLRRSAEVMQSNVRDMDLLARYGGEEFVLLASGTDNEGAVALAEKIRVALSEARFSVVDLDGPKVLEVTASFGVARFNGDDKRFFTDADRALYRAKARGKNCVVAADEEVDG